MDLPATKAYLPLNKYARRKATTGIVIHCTATTASQLWTVKDIRQSHLQRGFADIGYHYVITRAGVVEMGRPTWALGAHVQGHNHCTIGVSLVGGLAHNLKDAENNFTDPQWVALEDVISTLLRVYPTIPQQFGIDKGVAGHRDYSPDLDHDGVVEPQEWIKVCPSFSVEAWWKKRNKVVTRGAKN